MKSDLGLNTPAVKEYVQRASPLALCIAATGHLPSAVLLYRINWWKDHTRFKRDGHLWIVKSVDQWMVDTGLTRQQFKDAKNKLLERGLIVSDRFQTSINSTLTLAAVRLSDKGAKVPNGSIAGGSKVPNGSNATGAKVPNDPSTMEEEENLENEENQEEAAPVATAHPGKGFSGKVQEGGKTGKQAVPGSCSTPPALPVLVPHAAPLVKIGTSSPLAEVWQAIGEFFIGLTDDHAKADVRNGWVQAQLLRGTLPTEWSAKEWGHAKSLREGWQNHRSALVAFVCILRWEQFHHYCQKRAAKADHWKLSGTPDLQCLVHFKTQAAEFTQRHLADMQADMAEAEAKAAKEAATILYRGRWYEAGSFTENHFAHWKYYSWFVEGRDNVLEQLPVDHPLKIEQLTELERDRALDVIIDAITVQCEANAPVDQLVADHKITTEISEGIREWFAGKSWAQDIRKADLLKIAA